MTEAIETTDVKLNKLLSRRRSGMSGLHIVLGAAAIPGLNPGRVCTLRSPDRRRNNWVHLSFRSNANKQFAKISSKKSVYPPLEALGRATLGATSNGGFAAARVCGSDATGRISVVKVRDGLACSLYHGPDGMRRWVGWGVVSNGPDHGKPSPLKRPLRTRRPP